MQSSAEVLREEPKFRLTLLVNLSDGRSLVISMGRECPDGNDWAHACEMSTGRSVFEATPS